ncbi:hypothetical protein NW761_014640 [Fusarium oxysporum]|uniref:Uncharacterized protein n=1 Tax=Fusarium oxysporum f. sp. pisi HDV247 TaxID=1080344 RepID=W9NV64_FUSOX|nr:hypothetical protein FOVG_14034 [Fusarium oxysporum f. sp. pisi HDV247]KAJ4029096.1 hypothetical protein NW753_014346 [Fusarium oxysporum]WKT48286.1 hypothetical protein QSH57_013191 [Fusarium oxysporum f. sp. vasinfectum]KAJ4035488.1 hypothetical protein NW758_010522 [Fusarium oxysporum]KAJ4072751.1 hypothetical protein NW761_014640 [Fusarium oxysporum]
MARIKINSIDTNPSSTFPEIPTGTKQQSNWNRQTGLEKVLSRPCALHARGTNSDEDLRDNHNHTNDEAEPGTCHAETCFEWDLI